MIRCVVFDFDGVLVDSNAVKRQAYRDIFSGSGQSGRAAVDAVLRADTEDDRFGVIRAVLRRLPDSPDGRELDGLVMRYAEHYNTICEEHAAVCPEISGASAALDTLAVAHQLYVISATPQDPLWRIVERRGWTAYFRDVFGRPATKPENLARVMQRERMEGSEIVFVGDGRRDLDAARSVGCRFVGVRNQFNDFDAADLIMIDDLHRLPQLIESAVEGRPAGKAG